MTNLAWALFMLAFTGFLGYLIILVQRNERPPQDYWPPDTDAELAIAPRTTGDEGGPHDGGENITSRDR